MEHDSTNSVSLRDVFSILFMRKALILVVFLAIVLTVIMGVYIWPESYRARATFLVKLGRENVSVPAVTPSSQKQVVTMGVRKEDINSEIEILKNRFIIEKVVRKLGTDYLFPKSVKPKTFLQRVKYGFKRSMNKIKNLLSEILYILDLKKRLSDYEKAVRGIQKNLSAEQIRNSDTIEVRFKWFNPEIATEVLNTLIDFYLEHHLEIHRTSKGHEFFQNQVKLIGKSLKDSEDRLKVLEEKEGITSYEDQKKFLLAQATKFKASLKNTQTEIAVASAKIDELKKQMSALMAAITPGFNVAYKEAEKELLKQEVSLRASQAKRVELEHHIKSYQENLDTLSLYNIELKRLKRQIKIDEENYLLYRTKLEEARISNVLDTERIVNVKLIDPATASFSPVSPKKLLIIVLGIVLGLILGIGSAIISEYLDHSIKTPEDVRKYLDLPVLASIPQIEK